MKNLKKKVIRLLSAVVVLGVSGSAWSAIISNENPIDPTYSYYNMTHVPRIDMTHIDLNYTAGGQTKKGPGNSVGKFVATSSAATSLTLVGPGGATSTTFSGKFSLTASITSSGVLKGGTFSFTSSDAMFGFGTDRKGKPIAGNVFSGNLTAFGWSDSRGFLEFGTGGFTGWACAQGWCTTSERLWLNTYNGTLGLPAAIGNVTNWSGTAYGTAVIPVPGAVWLFGSGLLGLLGFARRRRTERAPG